MAIVVRRRADVVLFLLRHNYGGLKPGYLWKRLRGRGEILERKSRRGSKGWKGSFIPKRVAVPHKTDSSKGSLSACHCGKDAFPFSRYTGLRSFLRRLQPSLSEHLNCKAPRGYTSRSLAAEVCVRARCGPSGGHNQPDNYSLGAFNSTEVPGPKLLSCQSSGEMLLAGSESAERDLINREVGGCNLQPDSLGGRAERHTGNNRTDLPSV